jgi:hypothetical protein
MSNWKAHEIINLSNNCDPNFKLLKIIESKNNVLLDLRQYNKGKITKNGITLPTPEANWIANCINTNKTKATLEHGSRKLIFERKPSINIHVFRADGTERFVNLTSDEETQLKSNLNNIITTLNNFTEKLNQKTCFSNYEYVKES